MASEPALFPLPSGAHKIYVRCVALPWPHDGVGLEAVCRGCGWRSPALRTLYETAFDEGTRHARLMAEESGNPWWGTYGPY